MSMPSARAHHLALFEALEPRLLLDGAVGQEAVELFATSPAVFIENAGQWADEAIRYAHLGSGGNVLHTTDGPVVQLFGAEEDGGAAVSVRFDGAAAVNPAGQDLAGGYYNFYVGEQADWRSGVAGYETVAYEGLYAGVDLLTWGLPDGMKYEFRVAAGADPAQIEMTYTGADALYVKKGDLHVATSLGELVDDAPVAWQVKPNGKQRNLKAKFELVDADTVAFTLRRKALPGLEMVIDPNLAWGTFLGGADSDSGYGVAADTADNVLVAGRTDSGGWVSGGFDTGQNGDSDAFVAKLTSTGAHLWSTYMGGTESDRAEGVAVDGSNNVFVAGLTYSAGWAAGGWDTTHNGGIDAFAAKLTSAGTHSWSTYLGGSGTEMGHGIAVDGVGNVLVVGETASHGWTAGGYDTTYNGGYDAFAVKLTNAGAHTWSTYIGGTARDDGCGVAVDGANNVVVVGDTGSGAADWCVGGYDTTYNGSVDAFVVKLSSAGAHTWSTYVGDDSYDYGQGIVTDGSNIYATGYTYSTGWVAGGHDTTYNGDRDVFVIKLTSAGGHSWSTYLGGANDDRGNDVAVDGAGRVVVTGLTDSPGWVAGGFQIKGGKKAWDAFVVSLQASDGAHRWSSYLGGKADDVGNNIVVDSTDAILVTGWTKSGKWKPALAGGYDPTYGGVSDAFVVKINDRDGVDIAGSIDEVKSKLPATVASGDPKFGVIKKVIALCRSEGNLPVPAGLFTCSLYASADQNLDKPGDWFLGSVRTKIKLKKPGKPMKVQFKKVNVTPLAAGPYYLLAEFDVLNDVAEFNENNNTTATTGTIQWT